MGMKHAFLSILLSLSFSGIHASEPFLAPNAPKDQPFTAPSPERFERAIAPYVAQAKATYPQAKRRFLKGLGKGGLGSTLLSTQFEEHESPAPGSPQLGPFLLRSIWLRVHQLRAQATQFLMQELRQLPR
jgi:hypothetical protein